MIPEGWDLSGKRALITTDDRGWAPFLASGLAEAGADVAVAGDLNTGVAQAAEEVRKHGKRALEFVGDLTNVGQIKTIVHEVYKSWGGLDILVNGAQTQLNKPLLDVAESEWDMLMSLNVRTLFLLCREVGKQMLHQGQGRIVNIISGLAQRGLINAVPYCASQGAALQLTRSLALEWAQGGVRVNAIAAGWLDTDDLSVNTTTEDSLARFLPLRRLGHPKDLAPLVVYLASDACDFVTGTVVSVDGGAMAHG